MPSQTAVAKYINDLTAGTTYYVRVRSHKVVDGVRVYSAWGTKKSITLTK